MVFTTLRPLQVTMASRLILAFYVHVNITASGFGTRDSLNSDAVSLSYGWVCMGEFM